MKCRKIAKGCATGEIIFSPEPISFFGGVDPKTGVILDQSNPLKGKSVKDKILVFPTGKGSTVGSYVIYQLAKNGCAPKAMICKECEPIVAVGAIIADIPMVDRPEKFEFKTGQKIKVDADKGMIE
jgi:predicted aconitase with swiveling domain